MNRTNPPPFPNTTTKISLQRFAEFTFWIGVCWKSPWLQCESVGRNQQLFFFSVLRHMKIYSLRKEYERCIVNSQRFVSSCLCILKSFSDCACILFHALCLIQAIFVLATRFRKKYVYCFNTELSLGFFSTDHAVRRFAIWLTTNQYPYSSLLIWPCCMCYFQWIACEYPVVKCFSIVAPCRKGMG